jgi:hypothetical protein
MSYRHIRANCAGCSRIDRNCNQNCNHVEAIRIRPVAANSHCAGAQHLAGEALLETLA